MVRHVSSAGGGCRMWENIKSWSLRSLHMPAEGPRRVLFLRVALVVLVGSISALPDWARAQSPETSIREFSSGQIKKGVRSIGFGGDGATWGNYALVWRDAGTALFIYGDVHYTNGTDFNFVAVGATTPALLHH